MDLLDRALASLRGGARTGACGRWAVARAVHGRAARFLADWRACPEPVRRRWGLWLLVGLAASHVVAVVTVVAGRALYDGGALADEQRWLLAAYGSATLTEPVALGASTLAHPLFLLLLCSTVAVRLVRCRAPLAAASVLLAYPFASLPVLAAWQLWRRARPQLLDLTIVPPNLNAFPSGHTAQAIAVYGLLAYLWIRRAATSGERVFAALAAAAVTVVVVAGRLRLGVHWPSDVLGAIPVGITSLTGFVCALEAARVATPREG